MPLIKKDLKDILVCPADKAELTEIEETKQLECRLCKRRYPVKDGIPVMLIDEAEGGPGNDVSGNEIAP